MPTTRPSMPQTMIFPRTMTRRFPVPPFSAPASISTTPIMAAWLTAKAPIRTKERVLEK